MKLVTKSIILAIYLGGCRNPEPPKVIPAPAKSTVAPEIRSEETVKTSPSRMELSTCEEVVSSLNDAWKEDDVYEAYKTVRKKYVLGDAWTRCLIEFVGSDLERANALLGWITDKQTAIALDEHLLSLGGSPIETVERHCSLAHRYRDVGENKTAVRHYAAAWRMARKHNYPVCKRATILNWDTLDEFNKLPDAAEIRRSMGKKIRERRFKEYQIQTWQFTTEGMFEEWTWLEILRNGKRQYISPPDLYLKPNVHEGSEKWFEPGIDITGDEIPNLAALIDGDGRDCCVDLHIFELGETFRHIHKSQYWHMVFNFKDVDGDKFPELIVDDLALEYWGGPRTESIRLDLIRKWNPKTKQFEIAAELMRTPKPSPEEIAAAAKRLRISKQSEWYPGELQDDGKSTDQPTKLDLFRRMAQWIYAGHMGAALELYDAAWPGSVPGKEWSKKDFLKTLRSGKHWKHIKKLNRPKQDRACQDGGA